MSKKSKGCMFNFLFIVISLVAFAFWLFSERGNQESEETNRARRYKEMEAKIKTDVKEELSERRIEEKVSEERAKYGLPGKLINAIKQDLDSYYVDYYDVKMASSGCLWVSVPDNGKDKDGLAQTLCSIARKHYVSCVTIVDKEGNSLGRSMCQ
jgi:hypothetical protein